MQQILENNIHELKDNLNIIIKFKESTHNSEPDQPGIIISSEKYDNNTLSRKRKRCCKKENKERKFVCDTCQKSYLSFPALYTHKRNKHNIIPITGKQEIFKYFQQNIIGNYSYSSISNINNIKEICEKANDYITTALKDIYLVKSNNIFYKPNFNLKDYPLFKYFNEFKNNKKHITIPKPNENPSIDSLFVIYYIFFVEVSREKLLCSLAIKMLILLREYLNLVGWDNIKLYYDYKIYTTRFIYEGDYTNSSYTEEIPDLMNDFMNSFITLDDNTNLKDFSDIVHNFCNWLFVNDFTNYKVFYEEEENIINQ